jgi:hypothetical protein
MAISIGKMMETHRWIFWWVISTMSGDKTNDDEYDLLAMLLG